MTRLAFPAQSQWQCTLTHQWLLHAFSRNMGPTVYHLGVEVVHHHRAGLINKCQLAPAAADVQAPTVNQAQCR